MKAVDWKPATVRDYLTCCLIASLALPLLAWALLVTFNWLALARVCVRSIRRHGRRLARFVGDLWWIAGWRIDAWLQTWKRI